METAGLIAVFYVQPSGKGGLGNIFSFISFKLNLVAVGRPRLGEGSVATTEVLKRPLQYSRFMAAGLLKCLHSFFLCQARASRALMAPRWMSSQCFHAADMHSFPNEKQQTAESRYVGTVSFPLAKSRSWGWSRITHWPRDGVLPAPFGKPALTQPWQGGHGVVRR